MVFPRFYFSDRDGKNLAAGLQFHYKRERRRKQYWRLADFQEAAPPRRVFEDIRTGAQFAAQSVQEKVYFFDSDFGRPALEETRSAQTVMRMES